MQTEIKKILADVTKPYQYIGDEYLAYKKKMSDEDVSIVFAFPDKYEIGVSNLGVRVLYYVVNKEDGLVADRAYAPEFDCKDALEKNNVKLYAVESKKPLKGFLSVN